MLRWGIDPEIESQHQTTGVNIIRLSNVEILITNLNCQVLSQICTNTYNLQKGQKRVGKGLGLGLGVFHVGFED